MTIHDANAATSRRLARAWALVVGLTVVSVAVSMGSRHGETGLVAAAVALTASYFKASAVLDHFLDLRRAGKGWRGFFSTMLIVLLGGLMATYVAAG